MRLYLGLDTGATNTGVAIVRDRGLLRTALIKPKASMRHGRRLRYIRDGVNDVLGDYEFVCAGIEGHAFKAKGAGKTQIAEVAGVILLLLADRYTCTYSVPPNTAKKFFTGNGHADKDTMVSVACQTMRLSEGSLTEHEADAIACGLVAREVSRKGCLPGKSKVPQELQI